MTLRKGRLLEEAGQAGGRLSQRLILKVEWLRTGKKAPKVVYLGVLGKMRIVKLGTFKPNERRTYRLTPTSPTAALRRGLRETTPTWAPISQSSSIGGAGRSSSIRMPTRLDSERVGPVRIVLFVRRLDARPGYRFFSHFCR